MEAAQLKKITAIWCDSDLAIECSHLCAWIYTAKAMSVPRPHMIGIIRYELVDLSGDNSYAVLRSHTNTDNDALFVVFCGTANIFDIVHDLAATLQNIDDWDGTAFCQVHSGIYSKMSSNFKQIHNKVRYYMDTDELKIKNIYVTGHSLGGGMALLYLFNALLQRKQKTVDGKDLKLELYDKRNTLCITFGAPLVIAKDTSYNKRKADIFLKLNAISHHFVNDYDAVPRALGDPQWFKVLLRCVKRCAIDLGPDHNAWARRIKYIWDIGVVKRIAGIDAEQAADQLVDFLMKTMLKTGVFELVDSYSGIGLYYIMDNNKKDVTLVTDQKLKTILYETDVNTGEITTEDAMRLGNDHMIQSYINTLENNKSNIQSLYIANTLKETDRLFNQRFHNVLMKQKDAKKVVQKLEELLASIKQEINDQKQHITLNKESVTKLKDIWLKHKMELLKNIQVKGESLTEEIRANKEKAVEIERDVEKHEIFMGNLEKRWNTEHNYIKNTLQNIQQSIEDISKATQKNDNTLIDIDAALELDDDRISDIQKRLIKMNQNSKVLEALSKELSVTKGQIDAFDNTFIDISNEWNATRKEMKDSEKMFKRFGKQTAEIEEQNKKQSEWNQTQKGRIDAMEVSLNKEIAERVDNFKELKEQQKQDTRELMKHRKIIDEIKYNQKMDKSIMYKVGGMALIALSIVGSTCYIGSKL